MSFFSRTSIDSSGALRISSEEISSYRHGYGAGFKGTEQAGAYESQLTVEPDLSLYQKQSNRYSLLTSRIINQARHTVPSGQVH
jgi:hypothetical protein